MMDGSAISQGVWDRNDFPFEQFFSDNVDADWKESKDIIFTPYSAEVHKTLPLRTASEHERLRMTEEPPLQINNIKPY